MKKSFAAALALFAAPAFGHITLEQASAVAGSGYKAVFRVPHGCEASSTRAITIFLPPGVVGAKPMPKPGWTLDIKMEKLAKPYEMHGKLIGERPGVISWSGGSLRDSEYDEFVLRATLPAAPGTLHFRVLQQCEKGEADWVEVPVQGRPAPKYPAPSLELTPASPHAHHH